MILTHLLAVSPNEWLPWVSRGLCCLLGSLALWRMVTVIFMHLNRPRGLPIKYRSFALGRCFFNFDFMLQGPSLIFKAYQELGKVSFAIPALSEYQVLASSDLDVKAVCESAERTLSFHAAMVDRLKHKHTMFGFEHSDVDPHNTVPARTLKVLLRKNLPKLRPIINKRVIEGFDTEIRKGNEATNGWTSVSTFSLAKRVTERVNSQVFLGTELANTSNFMLAAIQYSHDAIVAAEICRQLPSMFAPIIAPLIMNWSGAIKKVGTSIRQVVERRVREIDSAPYSLPKPMDCLQWVIQSSHTEAQKRIDRLTQQVGALFSASSHQMPMALVYAIYSLCTHPEYVEPLRSETMDMMHRESNETFKQMHLLDAFLRESARLNPLDALSIQRKVLEPFDLPSGAHIPVGNLIAVPQNAILRNGDIYPNPEHFDPFRYFPNEEQRQLRKDFRTKYTDVSVEFPYWGSTKKPCPGRWYVSDTLKLALVHLIMNYDVKLADEEAPRSFFWTTALVPRLGTRILLRKR